MARDEPESLWNFGEPEPWRKGRATLITIALCYFVSQGLTFASVLLGGGVENAIALSIVLVLWWLMFAFIWSGTHWVRWILGAWTLLSGFAYLIWGIRDDSFVKLGIGTVTLVMGAYLFAPSVHFFAVRQRERIRWPEKLIVAAVFAVLVVSFFSALVAISVARSVTQLDAKRFGEEALRRIFVENDTGFVFAAATYLWKSNPRGTVGIATVMTSKHVDLGYVENTRVTDMKLRLLYDHPAKLRYAGVVDGEGFARCGAVLLRLEVERSADDWRINGLWWQCLNTRTAP